jgi:protein-ribulosamine 3-kinase
MDLLSFNGISKALILILGLPPGTTIISASPHGSSFWTRTARIDVELSDGSPHVYFMKVATGDTGRGMVRGEYEGVSKLHEVIPEGVPRPVAWGTYKSQPDTHFYLCDFLDMIEDLPDVHAFCLLLAKLHKESIPRSPNGKFGFHEVTYEGPMYQDTTWCDTWEESFVLRLKASLEQERLVHGSDKENEELLPALYEKVIPRLLRPLQTKGRSVKPALIHGDIWYGNMSTNADTGEPLMFDPSVFWGHNECEFLARNLCMPLH